MNIRPVEAGVFHAYRLTDARTNDEVNSRFSQISRKAPKKGRLTGHILLRNCLLKHVIEGKIEGETEVTGRRGRRRKQMILDYVKEMKRYRKMKSRSTRSYSVVNACWTRLWTCLKTDSELNYTGKFIEKNIFIQEQLQRTQTKGTDLQHFYTVTERKNGAVKNTHISCTGKNSLWQKILVDSHSHATIIPRSNKIPSTAQNCNANSPCAAHINTYSDTYIWVALKNSNHFSDRHRTSEPQSRLSIDVTAVCNQGIRCRGGRRETRQPRAKKRFKGRRNRE